MTADGSVASHMNKCSRLTRGGDGTARATKDTAGGAAADLAGVVAEPAAVGDTLCASAAPSHLSNGDVAPVRFLLPSHYVLRRAVMHMYTSTATPFAVARAIAALGITTTSRSSSWHAVITPAHARSMPVAAS